MILAVDIGTTRIKAALFDAEGRSLKLEIVDLPDESSNYDEEINARLWLKAFSEIIARLIATGEKNELKAIVICGNGPTILPIDERGEPLAPAITWLDRRAQQEAKEASIALN